MTKYTELAGIRRKVTPHTFRHTFASMLVAEGGDLSHIQKYMGHSTISTTQIYLHTVSYRHLDVYKRQP